MQMLLTALIVQHRMMQVQAPQNKVYLLCPLV